MKKFLVLAIALVLLTACGSQPAPETVMVVTTTPQLASTPAASTQAQPLPATAASSDSIPLDILSHVSYVDGAWLYIVGEVRNNSSSPAKFVEIVATLVDQDNKTVGTTNTFTELDIVPPGGKSPFEIATEKWAGMASYTLQVQGLEGESPRQDLVILSHDSNTDSAGWLHVQGEVQNTGNTSAEFVKLAITFYDADGNVVGSDFAFTEPDTVPAGGTSPFESGTDHWSVFDHYEIQVQGK